MSNLNHARTNDMVNNPPHYKYSKIECILLTEDAGFLLGNAIKYMFRAGYKNDIYEDVKKAMYYLNRAIIKKHTIPSEVGAIIRPMAEQVATDRGDVIGEALVAAANNKPLTAVEILEEFLNPTETETSFRPGETDEEI